MNSQTGANSLGQTLVASRRRGRAPERPRAPVRARVCRVASLRPSTSGSRPRRAPRGAHAEAAHAPRHLEGRAPARVTLSPCAAPGPRRVGRRPVPSMPPCPGPPCPAPSGFGEGGAGYKAVPCRDSRAHGPPSLPPRARATATLPLEQHRRASTSARVHRWPTTLSFSLDHIESHTPACCPALC
jgi:hypothetical protein